MTRTNCNNSCDISGMCTAYVHCVGAHPQCVT